MNKHILSFIALVFISLCVTGKDLTRYRVWLTDKAENSYSIEHPEEFLSAKAIERRALRNIEITEQDLPVSNIYLQKIKELGFNIFVTSRWMNTVVVAPTDSAQLEKVEQLPFVKKIECVQNNKSTFPFYAKNISPKSVAERSNESIDDLTTLYGSAWEQINQLNLAPLHQAGYCGNGMTIGVLDGGFYCIDMHPYIDHSKILGTHDFTRKSFSYKAGADHGAMVLMCMATNAPNTYIGTAPEANFWLIITETPLREFPMEEDLWVAGAEMADSVGVDIITASLGYDTFDDPDMNYTHDDLDGKTTFCSRGATIAASKGILVVTAAGNEYG
ncbi:MAG: S8 family serine peptidase, partial [Bacteroidales bacterium]|nr:S8 family serine peptidase [Bacteroidales bacterium]